MCCFLGSTAGKKPKAELHTSLKSVWLDSKAVSPFLRYRQQTDYLCVSGIADLNSTTYTLLSGFETCFSREVEKCLCIKEAEIRIKVHF